MPPPPHDRHGKDKVRADVWGPGTRIPAILISKQFDRSGVSRQDYDTTSIVKMLEQRFDLEPLVQRLVRSLAAALHAAER